MADAHVENENNLDEDRVTEKGPPKWRSTRFFLAYFLGLGLVVIFYQRVSFSMAIVCMMNHTALDLHRQRSGAVQGGLGLVWSIAWFVLVRDSPEIHPRIDPKEKEYIVNSRAAVTAQQEKVFESSCQG
nr:hypothetical protein BaRGS_028271 [Batillaria attramentaria]